MKPNIGIMVDTTNNRVSVRITVGEGSGNSFTVLSNYDNDGESFRLLKIARELQQNISNAVVEVTTVQTSYTYSRLGNDSRCVLYGECPYSCRFWCCIDENIAKGEVIHETE